MKQQMRWIAVLIALLTVVGLLASCNKKNPAPEPDSSATQEGTTEEPLQNEEAKYLPQEKYYDRDFTLLVSRNGSSSDMYLYIDEDNKPSGSVINNALYTRQHNMEELYGVTLVLNNNSNYKDVIAQAANTGNLFDVSMVPAVDTFAMAVSGAYANVLQLEELNLDASYWDQRIQSEYRIDDMLFTLEGDFTFLDELSTLVMVYNQTVYNNYEMETKYGTPYAMVSGNTWTLANMLEMVKNISLDSNNDDVMNENDTWGMVSELTAGYYFFLGSGLKPLQNDNGSFKLSLTDPTEYNRIYNVIEKTMTLTNNADIFMPNRPGAVSSGDTWTAASNVFEYDRTLFRSTTLSAVTRLKDMKSNFGILPIPTFFEDQTEYYCWVSGNTHCPMAFSRNVTNVHENAEIMERLCYHSRYGSDTVYSAFYDHLAYTRICKTADDIAMSEIIFASKTYDIDQACKITEVEPALYSIARAKNYTVLSSTLSGLVDSSSAKLSKYLITMSANNAD